MLLEVLQRERETVVDADERRRPFGEILNQPLGDSLSGPLSARTRWRLDFPRSGQTVGCVNSESLETRLGCLGIRIIDADVVFERRVHARAPKNSTSPSSRVKDDAPRDACAHSVLLCAWREVQPSVIKSCAQVAVHSHSLGHPNLHVPRTPAVFFYKRVRAITTLESRAD